MKDTYWAGFSVLFVFLYFIFHLRSLLLATYSMLLIIFSFAITQVLYIRLFGIDFFMTMHNLVIFIVLGISADNVFVMFDAWKQSNNIVEY
jgi:hypothetical protein